MAASDVYALNEIDRTEKIEDLHLAKFDDQYVLSLQGRTGEPKAARAVQLRYRVDGALVEASSPPKSCLL